MYLYVHYLKCVGMKKICLATICCFISFFSSALYAQGNIPSKLMKGIEMSTDEFTGVTTYFAKNCCLSIEQAGDSSKLYIGLSCSAFDTPVKLKQILILTNGNTTIVQHNSNFSSKEVAVRVMTQNSTGKFGTSSYKGAEFGTRIRYVEIWKEDATTYMPMIESIIDNLGKVKFEGENNTLYLEFSKKDAKRMKAILQLYEYMKQP